MFWSLQVCVTGVLVDVLVLTGVCYRCISTVIPKVQSTDHQWSVTVLQVVRGKQNIIILCFFLHSFYQEIPQEIYQVDSKKSVPISSAVRNRYRFNTPLLWK